MQILFLSHYFPPEGNAPASRTYDNSAHWVSLGHKVTVITCVPNVPSGKVYKGYKNQLTQKEYIDGIEVWRVWTYLSSNSGHIGRILNYITFMISATLLSFFIKRPDVILATSPQFFCGWAGILVSWIKRKPLVLEIRDLWPDSIVATGAIKNKPIIGMLSYLEKKMYSYCRKIVTVGPSYKKMIIKKGITESKISVIENGLNKNLFKPQQPNNTFKTQLGLEGKFICSYVGTIGLASGLDVVIRCAKLLKSRNKNDISFLLVGDGAVKNILEEEANSQNLDNIVFTGLIDKEKVPEVLSFTDVALIHLKENKLFRTVIPSKLYETAGMGLPIINGVEGSTSEFIERSGCGLSIKPGDAEDLYQALLDLKINPKKARDMGESGHNYVTKYYDRAKLSEKYLRELL